jgi:hypothetical protein
LDTDPEVRKRRERLKRVLQGLEALLGQMDSRLDAMTADTTVAGDIRELDRLRGQLAESVKDYLDQNVAFVDYVREQARKIEDANKKAAMSEKRSRPARDDARIQKLSDDLTRDLRLERVDNAIKELLDFLSDADFFAANASTGRKRRLRALQNAIEAALQK